MIWFIYLVNILASSVYTCCSASCIFHKSIPCTRPNDPSHPIPIYSPIYPIDHPSHLSTLFIHPIPSPSIHPYSTHPSHLSVLPIHPIPSPSIHLSIPYIIHPIFPSHPTPPPSILPSIPHIYLSIQSPSIHPSATYHLPYLFIHPTCISSNPSIHPSNLSIIQPIYSSKFFCPHRK